MSDFIQNGVITTLHDLGTISRDHLESLLARVTRRYKLGLILPVTASDMRAEPFRRIVRELEGVSYVERIVVVLGLAPVRGGKGPLGLDRVWVPYGRPAPAGVHPARLRHREL